MGGHIDGNNSLGIAMYHTYKSYNKISEVLGNGLRTGDIQMGILGAYCSIIYIRYPSSHRVDYIYNSVV